MYVIKTNAVVKAFFFIHFFLCTSRECHIQIFQICTLEGIAVCYAIQCKYVATVCRHITFGSSAARYCRSGRSVILLNAN